MPDFSECAVREARAGCKTRREAAARLGCSYNYVANLLVRYGLPQYGAGRTVGRRRTYSEQWVRKADILSTSLDDFAHRVGCSVPYARSLRQRFQLPSMASRSGQARQSANSAAKIERLIPILSALSHGRTLQDVGEQAGVSRQRISKILKRDRIHCRYVYYHDTAYPLRKSLMDVWQYEKMREEAKKPKTGT